MKRTVLSWAFYDFANTVFSAIVLTYYFPLYLTSLTQQNVSLGLATTSAMLLAGLFVPWLGALSDRTGKTKVYLVRTTLLCILFVFGLSLFTGVPMLIFSFLLACFFYHSSLVFYSSLLPVIAEPREQGFASGAGTGLGYLGILFALPVAHVVDGMFGRRFVFLVAGVLFLLFSLPLFFWVPERKVDRPTPFSWGTIGGEWKKVFKTLRSLPKNPPFLWFFLGNFFVVDTINTMIFWLVVYMTRVFDPSRDHLMMIYLAFNFTAFLFGFAAGKLTDRWNAHKVLLGAAVSLFLTVILLGLTGSLWAFVVLALTGGSFGFAAVWTAARKRVVELSPSNAIGEYFGLYNLTTKISVAGSLVFSILADRFGFRLALLSLAFPSGVGFLFLWLSRKARAAYPP